MQTRSWTVDHALETEKPPSPETVAGKRSLEAVAGNGGNSYARTLVSYKCTFRPIGVREKFPKVSTNQIDKGKFTVAPESDWSPTTGGCRNNVSDGHHLISIALQVLNGFAHWSRHHGTKYSYYLLYFSLLWLFQTLFFRYLSSYLSTPPGSCTPRMYTSRHHLRRL